MKKLISARTSQDELIDILLDPERKHVLDEESIAAASGNIRKYINDKYFSQFNAQILHPFFNGTGRFTNLSYQRKCFISKVLTETLSRPCVGQKILAPGQSAHQDAKTFAEMAALEMIFTSKEDVGDEKIDSILYAYAVTGQPSTKKLLATILNINQAKYYPPREEDCETIEKGIHRLIGDIERFRSNYGSTSKDQASSCEGLCRMLERTLRLMKGETVEKVQDSFQACGGKGYRPLYRPQQKPCQPDPLENLRPKSVNYKPPGSHGAVSQHLASGCANIPYGTVAKVAVGSQAADVTRDAIVDFEKREVLFEQKFRELERKLQETLAAQQRKIEALKAQLAREAATRTALSHRVESLASTVENLNSNIRALERNLKGDMELPKLDQVTRGIQTINSGFHVCDETVRDYSSEILGMYSDIQRTFLEVMCKKYASRRSVHTHKELTVLAGLAKCAPAFGGDIVSGALTSLRARLQERADLILTSQQALDMGSDYNLRGTMRVLTQSIFLNETFRDNLCAHLLRDRLNKPLDEVHTQRRHVVVVATNLALAFQKQFKSTRPQDIKVINPENLLKPSIFSKPRILPRLFSKPKPTQVEARLFRKRDNIDKFETPRWDDHVIPAGYEDEFDAYKLRPDGFSNALFMEIS